MARRDVLRSLLFLSLITLAVPILAQQTGAIHGKVTASDGSALPGVTVEARSNVLPQARVTVTEADGTYRLPALPPGSYSLTFNLSGMAPVTRKAEVLLSQDTPADAVLGVSGVSESITVTAQASIVNKESTEIQTGLSSEEIHALPITQDYRDLQKFIPGAFVTGDLVRGSSAGGSGQDNVYMFDGVNITMPFFGVQVGEPNTHDIAQVTVLKGGAKAVDFERSGGFQIDSVSKSGTNKLTGEVTYQVLNHGFVSNLTSLSTRTQYKQDRSWASINVGGPLVSDRLFFYTSYYHPYFSKNNQTNNYGSNLPDFTSRRNEYFGKLTYTPTAAWLINASYRDSHRQDSLNSDFGVNTAGTTGSGSETRLKLGTFETSWIINPRSFATMKLNDFKNPGSTLANNLASVQISTAPGTVLDVAHLDQLGLLTVPSGTGSASQVAFVKPFIELYGYGPAGSRTGGGTVGVAAFTHDDDDFYRKNGQVGYNLSIGTNIVHDLHVGYQRYRDSEDRFQQANGWGSLSIPGGSVNCPASACGSIKPAFFQAVVGQQGLANLPTIHSEFTSQNVELNDSIRMNNWSFNVGLMASNDVMYGQGLATADNIAGFVSSRGTKYKMHSTPFKDMLQPRLGATWAYNGQDTVYASYARYFPAANSDARAASWDRNLQQNLSVYFDQNGVLMGVDPVKSSSGKLFVPGIKPRETNELMIGTSQQITPQFSARAYGRYRKGTHFWEDTNNNARIAFGKNVPGVKQELYIPDLSDRLKAIGSGSTYVIAELDGAFTKYYEATMESDWHNDKMFLRGSYTWSHYYGNFDQDNTTGITNDMSAFIGSSNIGDGAGRQLWNNKYGDLRGDRRNVFKVYGSYTLPWNATTGALAYYQSGQPYQLESFIPYASLTGSTNDSNRFAEPAGSRRTPAHYQLDWNYIQNIGVWRGLNLQLQADLFNVFNKQTGFDYEERVGSLGGVCNPTTSADQCKSAFKTGLDGQLAYINKAPFARNFYDPRRFQIALRVQY